MSNVNLNADDVQTGQVQPRSIARLLVIGQFLVNFASFLCVPYLPFHLSSLKIATPTEIGAVLGSAPLFMAFAGFFLGTLADRFGSRTVLITCAILRAVAFASFSFADTVLEFAILNAIAGIASSGISPVAKALASALLPPKERGKLFSDFYVAGNVAAVTGPLIGAWLAETTAAPALIFTGGGIVLLLYSLVLLWVLAGLPALSSKPTQKRVGFIETLTVIGKDRWLQGYLLLLAIITLGYSQFESLLPQVIASPKHFSWLLATNAAIVIAFQHLVGKHFSAHSQKKLLLFGILGIAAGLTGFGLSGKYLVGLFVSIAVFTCGEMLEALASNVLLDQKAPEHLRGAYFGAMNFKNLGRFVGPIAGGSMIASSGAPKAFMCAAGLLVVSAALFFVSSD